MKWGVFLSAATAALAVASVLAPLSGARHIRPRPHRHKPKPAVVAPVFVPNAIQRENSLPGTPGWLGPQATNRAIEVYAGETDAAAGDTVDVHVSAAPAADYRLLVYRLGWYGGVGARQVACVPSCTGAEAGSSLGMPAAGENGTIRAGWPTSDRFTVGSDWVSGYYLVRALLVDGPQAGSSASTYVVVRSAQPTAMLVQVPVDTWQAYDSWGGTSLYDFAGLNPRATRVSFDRPYCWSCVGGQGPLGWELPLVRFIERTGYDVSYQSDVFTDANPASLLQHRLDVVAGHSEYWTRTMRDAWNGARDAGVNLAFMGANDAYWQVQLTDAGRTVLAYKSTSDPNPDPLGKTAMFRELTPPRYECELIGIQHQGTGLTWSAGDYTVQPAALADPWMRGTGFNAGDTVRGIVGVEADTIPGNQTAASSCGHALTVFFHRERGGDKDGNADATRYVAPSGATVFATGSHQYAWGLDDFPDDPDQGHGLVDPRLQAFTKNAFDAMTAPRTP